jgi:hypothetical protein
MSVIVTFPAGIDIEAAGVSVDDIVTYSLSTPLFLAPNAGFIGTLMVTEVLSPVSFSYEGYNADGTVANLALDPSVNQAALTYTITHPYTKDEQAQNIADIATSLANKRVILNWPPYGEIDITDANGNAQTIVVDGSYIATCFAAAKSANPAQQSFSSFDIPGPTRLKYSNDYFTPAQLKVMVDAGVNVFVQDVEGGQIYLLRQRSTDVSTFANGEISMTCATDQIALDLIATLRPFKGKYTITDNYLTLLQTTTENYFFTTKNKSQPICGPLCLDGEVVSIRASLHGKNTDLADGVVELIVSAEIGKPGNWINIKLLV